MDKIICYTHLLPMGEEKSLSFWDILLDDRWTAGEFSCPEAIYQEVGYLNQKLQAKQNYEFLLRAVEKYPVTALGSKISYSPASDEWESFRTDCYIIGKYQEKLRTKDFFDPLVSMLLEQASQFPDKENAILFLEKMISRAPEYYQLDDNTRPILLYRDSGICYNVLNLFLDCLASAFRACHQRVEFFDAAIEGKSALTKYIGQHFKAIIGAQTYFFAIMMQDKVTNLHDLIHGPKYNFILDHPAWLKEEIAQAPKDYYLLLHDRNYIRFSQKYYPNLSGCIHFPPAGTLPLSPFIPMEARQYEISFIGTYWDYRERLAIIRSYPKTNRLVTAYYLKTMRTHPDMPGEEALEHTRKHYGIPCDNEKFLQLFYDMNQAFFCIFLYYREKVIEALLDAGLTVHVFSESWNHSPFAKHPNLVCHPGIDAKESLSIMQNSKISLNIMSWHKDGLTERIFNAMLCQSVVLSDTTTALQEEFINEQDLLLFSLDKISHLPMQVKALLSDNNKLQQMALSGYQKAFTKHTWKQRAELLLKYWE